MRARLLPGAKSSRHRATRLNGSCMDYIRFGQTGLKVSQLCLGTMSMGSSAWKGWVLDEDDSIPILRRALDLGINFFDMADWYSTGRNEEVDAEIEGAPQDGNRIVLVEHPTLP